jgi:hypothetical protein
MSKSKRAWRQRAGVLRSGGPALNTGHSAANPGEHDAVAAPTPRQRFLSPFLQRFLLVFALAMAMLWVVHALAGAPIALGDVLNMITCAVLGSRRGYREAHLSERLLLAYGGLVLLPLALIFGGFSMWMTFGFCAFVTALVWGFCMYQRRQNQRPITVWATLPSGQDIPLDTRPFRCGTCRGCCVDTHHVAFAPGKPIDLPSTWTTNVWVEKPRRSTGDVVIALKITENGLRLSAAPEDFTERQWGGELSHQWAEAPTALQ